MAYLKYNLNGSSGTVQSFSDPSYTIRSFSSGVRTVNVNEYDTNYHTYYSQTSGSKDYSYYFGNSIPASGTVFSKNQENWSAPTVSQSSLDIKNQLSLDSQVQFQLESGNPVSPNADGSNNSGILISVSGTVEAASLYQDNLLQGVFANPGTYYIQMPIWRLPGTANAATLNRSLSSITFSSSDSFDPTKSVTIPFNSPALINSFNSSGTADILWKIDRNVLTDQSISGAGVVDLSSLRRIKFKLVSSGGAFVFRTGQMKLVPSYYSYSKANINTKEGILSSEPMPSSITQSNLPILLQDGLRVKNFSHVAKVNFDSLPNIGGTHEVSLYGRVNSDFKYGVQASPTDETNAYIKAQLLIASSSYTIKIYENNYSNTNNPVYSATYSESLTPGVYFFIVDYSDDKMQVCLFSGETEHFISALKAETGYLNITNSWLNGDPLDSDIGRGYAGYEFKPDPVGNFYLDYLYAKEAVLGEYVSKTFNSYSPLSGISLFPASIPSNNLISDDILNFVRVENTNNFLVDGVSEVGSLATPQSPSDDVYIEEDTQIFYANKSLKVSKSSNAKIAAVQYNNLINVNDFSKLTFKVKLRFNNVLNQGDFRLVFWDEKRTKIAYITPIPDIVSDAWNDVEVTLLSDKLYNNKFILEIGHYGEIVTTPPITDPKGYFWLEDPRLEFEAIEWEASNNGGKSYTTSLNRINKRYNSINFTSRNYYAALANKQPYILWDFNSANESSIIVSAHDSHNSIKGQLSNPLGTVTVAAQTVNTPGTIAITGSATYYSIPASVGSYLKNSAMAFYGGTDSYLSSSPGNLGTALSIAPGSVATNISASVRIYTDTINNNIKLISCQNSPYAASVTTGWDLSISGTSNYTFSYKAVGTLTATIPAWTGSASSDKKWHTAAFTYDSTYNKLKLYWDGQYVGGTTLASDLNSNYPLRITGPGSVSPQNTFNNFNPSRPFLFVDSLALYGDVLTQDEIYQDYITSTSTYNQLKLRAKAYAKNAWLSGYEIIPHYSELGLALTPKAKQDQIIRTSDSITITDTPVPPTNVSGQIVFDTGRFDLSRF